MRNLLLAGVLLGAPALAHLSGIGLSPPHLFITLEPGESWQGSFTVYTQNGRGELHPSLTDWTLSPQGTLLLAPPGSLPYSAATWISLAENPFELLPSHPIHLELTIHVPPQTPTGDYWAAIALKTAPSPLPQGVGLRTSLEVLEIVYVRVGHPEAQAALTLERTSKGWLAVFANRGTQVLRLHPKLRFLNHQGILLKEVSLSEEVLLRGDALDLPLDGPFPKGSALLLIEAQAAGLRQPLVATLNLGP